MGAVSWFRDHLTAAVVCFVFASTLAAASGVALAVWVVVATLAGGVGGAPAGVLFPVLLLGVVVGLPLAAASLVGVALGVLARGAALASRRWAWLVRAADAVEQRSRLARLLGLSDAAASVDARPPEQRVDDRLDRLKARYVDGRLSEAELERRAREVLADEGVETERGAPDATALDDRLRETRRERDV